jgi:hypothetical protein
MVLNQYSRDLPGAVQVNLSKANLESRGVPVAAIAGMAPFDVPRPHPAVRISGRQGRRIAPAFESIRAGSRGVELDLETPELG